MARHPSTTDLLEWFSYDHLPAGSPRDVSEACHELANALVDELPDDPELSAGLRKLLEGKDCFVRAAIRADRRAAASAELADAERASRPAALAAHGIAVDADPAADRPAGSAL